MIKTIKKINKQYDDLPEPKRFILMFISMVILIVLKSIIDIFYFPVGTLLFLSVASFLICARLRGK